MSEDDIFAPRDASLQPVIGKSEDELWTMLETEDVDVFRAMRSVWVQAPEALNHELSSRVDLGYSVPLDAPEFIQNIPHGFDPDFGTRQRMPSAYTALAGPNGPPPEHVISWWAAMFGPYTPTGNKVPNIVVYAPIYDYAADPMVEQALSVTLDYNRETTRSSKLSLSFKGVGLTGTQSMAISTTLKIPNESKAFQVSVPSELELTEYVGPMAHDIRYTAKLVHAHAPVHLRDGEANFQVIKPRTQALAPVNFMTATNLNAEETDHIARSKGFEATAEKTFSNGAILSLEYGYKARSEIGVTYKKLRTDALERQLWKDAHGLVRILEP